MLTDRAVAAIADLALSLSWDDDVVPALEHAGVVPQRTASVIEAGIFWTPSAREHVRGTLAKVDLDDEDTVNRVLQFTNRIAELYAAKPKCDESKLVRLRNALGDDGYTIPFLPPAKSSGEPRVSNIHYGPVFHGSAQGAQIAWNNGSVVQGGGDVKQTVSQGYEGLADTIVTLLQNLPVLGLTEIDQGQATTAANEVLVEVTAEAPDPGAIRKAVAALKGYLAPVAMGLATGAGEGAKELAHEAIQNLGNLPFS